MVDVADEIRYEVKSEYQDQIKESEIREEREFPDG